MMSVSQIEEALREIMGPEIDELAKRTGFVQRERKGGITGSNFVQTLVFGWRALGDATLGQLTQMAQNCELTITGSGLSQRGTREGSGVFKAGIREDNEIQNESGSSRYSSLKTV